MSEPRRFPFGGVPVYNPNSLSKEEALAQFHARQAAYEGLMDLLREDRPSHVLIIGTRGMGKTTLLQRVGYGVEDDTKLKTRYLVLAFPEEQYNVNRLHHFLLNTVDALADAMERFHNERMLARVEAYAERIGKLPQEQIEELVPQFLAEVSAEMETSFLLLVDNADRLFETIENREQWTLREMLSNRRDLTLFGATTQASEGIYGHDRAFFEFFKIHRLTPLTLAEVRELLLRLSESVEGNEGERGSARRRVEAWLAADAARLRTLVQLTGGNPRTTVLLFHLVLDGLDGGAREYLEQLLDQCTPNYKGRVDELPPQAQQVLDAVALRWDPVMAMEIADDTGLETGVVSTQLTRLVRQGLLEKADPGDSKKALYQVAERFFNIWYLMRASRRVRAKLRWFVEFLRVFFDSDELEQMAWERLQVFRHSRRTRSAGLENAFAYVLASGVDRSRIEDYLRRECVELEQEWRPYIDLIRPALIILKTEIRGEATVNAQLTGEAAAGDVEELRTATTIDPANAENWMDLGRALLGRQESIVEAEAALRTAVELDPKLARGWLSMGRFLAGIEGRRDEAVVALRRALELDPNVGDAWTLLGALLFIARDQRDEAFAALRKAVELDPQSGAYWGNLGGILAKVRGGEVEAEAACRRAVELDPRSGAYWGNLGGILAKVPGRDKEAEAAYRNAIDLDPKSGAYWGSLGGILARVPGREADAVVAYRNAIDLDPKSGTSWFGLGSLVARFPERREEAEAAFRRAVELGPRSPLYRAGLGMHFSVDGRLEEAEAALREAIEIDPKQAVLWVTLGFILSTMPTRTGEAEAVFRRAIELDPKSGIAWSYLGVLLGMTPERSGEAADALRRAIELDGGSADSWCKLGISFAEIPESLVEAEAAFRKALEFEPENETTWRTFGFFLACQARRPEEAAVALRKVVQLRPDDPVSARNLGVLLFCELSKEHEAVDCLRRASQLQPGNPVSAAVLAACIQGSDATEEQLAIVVEAFHGADRWDELLELCDNYSPFGKILLRICELIQERDGSNPFAPLYRAMALAQLGDFPRASVALEDALAGDPIVQLTLARRALEVFFAAAVRNGRVRDCIELLDRKEWRDAWRPIYEALRAAEAGSAEYLKRIAVEIREPALEILRRIAPQLAGLRIGGK